MKQLIESLFDLETQTAMESLFDKDLTSKNLNPEEIAEFYKNYKYNRDNGKKDCLGKPLKMGDIVLFNEDPYGHSKMYIGIYNGAKGNLCEILLPAYDLTHHKKVGCWRVVKIDPPVIK